MKPKLRIALKILELILCVACVLMKLYTDREASQLYYLNRKLSREWSLLNNVHWTEAGDGFAYTTYGGYSIIAALMVISRLIDSRNHPTIFEKFILAVGVIQFFAMGGLCLGSLYHIPRQLHDNAIILGCLSLIVGILFIVDLSDPLYSSTNSDTQADLPALSETNTHTYRLGEKFEVNSNVTNTNDVNPLGVQITAHDMPLLNRSRGGANKMDGEYERSPGRYSKFGHDGVNAITTMKATTNNLPKRQQPILEMVTGHFERNMPNPFISKSQIGHWKDEYFESDQPVDHTPVYRPARPSIAVSNENHGYMHDNNSYAKGIVVDENCCDHQNGHRQTLKPPAHRSSPASLQPGYVANVAKMWEKITKPIPPNKPKKDNSEPVGLQTIV